MLDQVRAGRREAFGHLYTAYLPRARAVAATAGVNPSDVEDIVSEAFAAILAALIGGVGPTTGFAGYLAQTVRNRAVSHWRRHGRVTLVDDLDQLDATAEQFPDIEDRGRHEAARNAMASLSAEARAVLEATLIEGHSLSQVAERWETTSNAVALRAMRARRSLREAYLTHSGSPG